MKTGLEEQMKAALNGASLKDLLPGFDAEDTWEELQTQLPGKKALNRAIPPRWIRYAAAVLVVILGIAGTMMLRAPDRQPEVASGSDAIPRNTALAAAPPAIPLPAPPVLNAMVSITAKAPPRIQHLKPSSPQKSVEAKRVALGPEPVIAADNPVKITPAVIAIAAPGKVVHYLDLEQDAVTTPPAPQIAAAPLIRMRLNKPGSPDGRQPSKPFKDLVFALGR